MLGNLSWLDNLVSDRSNGLRKIDASWNLMVDALSTIIDGYSEGSRSRGEDNITLDMVKEVDLAGYCEQV